MDKASLRAAMRSVGPLDPGVSSRVGAGLFRWLSPRLPGTVSAFLPMEGEVNLRSLMDQLPGWRWVLPRVESDRSITFRDAALPVETHPFGMEQPIDSGTVIPILEIDVLLVPGLAFDREGRRLGNGAGHYDRILFEARPNAESIGMAPSSHLVDLVPTEDHFFFEGSAATEKGVVRCSPNG